MITRNKDLTMASIMTFIYNDINIDSYYDIYNDLKNYINDLTLTLP